MRFYTKRCCKDFRTQGEAAEMRKLVKKRPLHAADRRRYDALHTSVSDKVEIIDGNSTFETFAVNERDVDFIVAALNAADRQEQLCDI